MIIQYLQEHTAGYIMAQQLPEQERSEQNQPMQSMSVQVVEALDKRIFKKTFPVCAHTHRYDAHRHLPARLTSDMTLNAFPKNTIGKLPTLLEFILSVFQTIFM